MNRSGPCSCCALRHRFEQAFGPDYLDTPGGRRLFGLACEMMLAGEQVVMATIGGHRWVGNYLPKVHDLETLPHVTL